MPHSEKTHSWGVLGAARIARRKVMPALMAAPNNRLVAVASRDLANAEAGIAHALGEAAKRGIVPAKQPRAFGSYDALLDDPAVQAVYIPLPNHLHLPWAIKALAAGKHVLIEKPAVLNGEEARSLAAEAEKHPNLLVAEGFMYRYHPQWAIVEDWVRQGRLGALRSASIQFSFFSGDPNNIRNRPETGGGALLDIGCYAGAAARRFGGEPNRIRAVQEHVDGIDRHTRADLVFDANPEHPFHVNFQTDIRGAHFQRIDLNGEAGRLVLEKPFNPWPNDPVGPVLYDQQGDLVERAEPIAADHFLLQAEAFSAAAIEGTPLPYGLHDLVAQADLLDAVRASAKAGQWAVRPPARARQRAGFKQAYTSEEQ